MILTVVIFTVVFCILIYVIKNTFFPSRKQDRLRTIARYEKLQDTSLQLQTILSEYIFANNADDDIVVNNITCGEYLNKLKKDHDKHLSDYGYTKLKHGRSNSYRKKIKSNLKVQAKRLQAEKTKILSLQKRKSLAS